MVLSKEIYIRCGCSAEVLRIEHNKEDKQYYISIYEYKTNKYPLSQKLRWIWRILKYGTPYGDQMVIDEENAGRLGRWLNYE